MRVGGTTITDEQILAAGRPGIQPHHSRSQRQRHHRRLDGDHRCLPHLRRLRLGETAVTDAGLGHLSGLTELESLDLHMTGVTDEGLPALESLEKLRALYLWETGVSKTGAAGLRASRPWLQVDLGSP